MAWICVLTLIGQSWTRTCIQQCDRNLLWGLSSTGDPNLLMSLLFSIAACTHCSFALLLLCTIVPSALYSFLRPSSVSFHRQRLFFLRYTYEVRLRLRRRSSLSSSLHHRHGRWVSCLARRRGRRAARTRAACAGSCWMSQVETWVLSQRRFRDKGEACWHSRPV